MSSQFYDMEIWQSAFKIALDVHSLSKKFPEDEKFVLTPQLRRAALSTFSNIAEGFGRDGTLDKRKFYIISRGSMMELESQLEYAYCLSYISQNEKENLTLRIRDWYYSINKLIKTFSR